MFDVWRASDAEGFPSRVARGGAPTPLVPSSPPLHSLARAKLGLLEKHGDYKARADDHHRKQATLASLRRKAEQRNPDEFYFAMERQKTRGGVHVAE